MSSKMFGTFHSIIVFRAHWVSLVWLYSRVTQSFPVPLTSDTTLNEKSQTVQTTFAFFS